ncbi:MAG TPA: hypothetical protein VHC45_13365 [Gaiellaceae bacterium]|nr:hypothetical protein [Gaiellaceae bacterium]
MLAASSAVALAGCGGHRTPALDRTDAHRLIALANHVAAAKGGCAQQRAIDRVQSEAARLVNARRVPPELQESLVSAVNALVADQPTCLPAVPASSTTSPARPPGTPRPPGRIHPPHVFHHHPHRGHAHDHGHRPGRHG